jgi:D-alanine-D-alanine ligase
VNESKILICYNEPVSFYSNYTGKEKQSTVSEDLSESEFVQNLNLISSVLESKYKNVNQLGFTSNIKKAISSISNYKPDMIFNFVESIEGDTAYESYVAGMFDIMEIEYTGNSALCLGNCLNKIRTKQLLTFNSVRNPAYVTVEYGQDFDLKNIKLKFPCIVKIVTEDASIGISENSVVSNITSLQKQCDFLFKNYRKDLIRRVY